MSITVANGMERIGSIRKDVPLDILRLVSLFAQCKWIFMINVKINGHMHSLLLKNSSNLFRIESQLFWLHFNKLDLEYFSSLFLYLIQSCNDLKKKRVKDNISDSLKINIKISIVYHENEFNGKMQVSLMSTFSAHNKARKKKKNIRKRICTIWLKFN